MLRIPLAILLLFAVQDGTGQEPTSPASPPGRAHHTLFYDDAQERVMLTGGTIVGVDRSYEILNDLWRLDATGWSRLPPSGDRLSGARVDVDAQQRVFSFGGWNTIDGER
jgi:hypothetical protein